MEILARGVGRRKEAVAQVQILKGTGQFLINNIPAQQYLHNNTCSILSVKSPLTALNKLTSTAPSPNPSPLKGGEAGMDAKQDTNATFVNNVEIDLNFSANPTLLSMDTIVKVKGGGLVGQAEAIKLGLARALCELKLSALSTTNSSLNADEIRKQLKDKGYLTQDSRVKERRKYGLKKARKATQYNKR